MVAQISQLSARTKVYFGPGSTKLIGVEAAKAGITKAMIVTDRGVYKAGLLKDVEKYVTKEKIGYEIFQEVDEDADVNVIHRIATLIKETGCNGVIVVGGGSPICAAKGAALEVSNKVENIRPLFDRNRLKTPPLPVICLPTTAGSGSDVVEGFPVVDHERRLHLGIGGDGIGPRVSILDPELLRTIPRWPMLFAEVDALSHALDALCSRQATVVSDALAYEAIRIIMNNIKEATFTDSLTARMNQHIGSTLGMLAGSNAGLAVIHAFGGLIFTAKGPHGYKCGLTIPIAMDFNLPVCEEKFSMMATILGEATTGKTRAELAQAFIRRVKQLLIELEFPRKFRPEDASREMLPEIMEEMKHGDCARFLENNLRTVNEEDLQHIIEALLKGWEL